MITLCVTLAVTLAIEQLPKEQEVAHGATINLDAGKTLCWAGATPLLHTVRGQIDPQGRSSPTGSFLRCAARIWAKGVKKVGITYFSFVFTTFFTLSCA